MHDAYEYAGRELELFAQANHWKEYFASRLRPFLTGDVLEVGAGIGTTTLVLRNGHEGSWTCLEPDPRQAAQIEGRRPASPAGGGDGLHVIVGSIRDLPDAAIYDTILYVDVLEHIEKDAEEIEAAARRLRPHGRLIVLGPAHPWLFSPFDRSIGHFRRYTIGMLRKLTPTGTQLIRWEYLDSVGLLASAANRFWLRKAMPDARQIRTWDGLMVPCSRVLDPILGRRLGKSVLAAWQRNAEREEGTGTFCSENSAK